MSFIVLFFSAGQKLKDHDRMVGCRKDSNDVIYFYQKKYYVWNEK